jgi:adenylate kinase
MLRVELVGVSGSGKSTIAKSASEILQQRNNWNYPLRVLSPDASRPLNARALALSPALSLAVARALRNVSDPGVRSRLIKVVRRDLEVRHLADVLLPEGAMHPLSTAISMIADPHDVLKMVVPRLSHPDVIVVIEAAPDEAVSRVRRRAGKHRFDRIDWAEAVEAAKSYYASLERMIPLLDAEVWRINSSAMKAHEASELLAELLQ